MNDEISLEFLIKSIKDIDNDISFNNAELISINAIKYSSNLLRLIDKLNLQDEIVRDNLVEKINFSIRNADLDFWEETLLTLIAPEISKKGNPYLRWQSVTKKIRSNNITSLQIILLAIFMAKIKKYNASLYGLSRIIKEFNLTKTDLLICLSSIFSNLGSTQTSHFSGGDEQLINKELLKCFRELIDVINKENYSKNKLLEIIEDSRRFLDKGKEHGHEKFLEYCAKNLIKFNEISGKENWIVEVGCSREIIEGQNSTKSIIEFAHNYGYSFLGIDLDENNIKALERDFNNTKAKWIIGKGEEVLKEINYNISAIYLDAYDIVHPNHSHIRQSKYKEKYGNEINQNECYKMHLEAVINVVDKIAENGIIGIDDTWKVEDGWEGKGALALPWLEKNGWKVTFSSKQSVILTRI